MKAAKDFLEEANAVVPKISTEDGIAKHAAGNTVFVDVRDSGLIAETGTIAGAERVTRGMIEFVADPATPFHNPALTRDADIVRQGRVVKRRGGVGYKFDHAARDPLCPCDRAGFSD